MVDYESGSPSWDLGMILTRHGTGFARNEDGTTGLCARVTELRRTAGPSNASGLTAEARLKLALAVECSCGAGDSDAETTSHRNVKHD